MSQLPYSCFLIEYSIINLGTHLTVNRPYSIMYNIYKQTDPIYIIKPIPFIYLWTIYIIILFFKILKTKVIEQDLQNRATNQKIINFVVLNEKEQIKQTISMVCMINILEKSKVQWLGFKFFSTIYIHNFGWQLLFFSTI